MPNIPKNVEWVAGLVPGMEGQLDQFRVSTDEVDDELVEVFVEELRRLAGELQEGLQSGDAEMVRMAAHSIKGMGGTIGLPEISVLGMAIELRAKENRVEDAGPMIGALADWLTSLE